jgi:hypothetical protein
MLVLYGLCILGFLAAALLWLNQMRKTALASAAAATAVSATQQANTTATSAARSTQQAEYRIVDEFTDNHWSWLAETVDDEYMNGSISIHSGLYAWNMREVKQPFVYWSNFLGRPKAKDFDMYVDTKIADSAPGDACSGFVFRTASMDWEEGAYTFSVCNDSYFGVSYYEQGKWEPMSGYMYSDVVRNGDWNRLEVSARGDHFTFTVNHTVVYETTDDRQPIGGLALLVEVNETNPVTIWFDNFGFQPR